MSRTPAAGPAPLETFQIEPAVPTGDAQVTFDDVLEIPVTLALEVGRSQIDIRELLQLTAGSVVQLDRSAADAFDVLVNGTLLARGEAMVVNGKCAVRLTDVVRPAERLHRND